MSISTGMVLTKIAPEGLMNPYASQFRNLSGIAPEQSVDRHPANAMAVATLLDELAKR